MKTGVHSTIFCTLILTAIQQFNSHFIFLVFSPCFFFDLVFFVLLGDFFNLTKLTQTMAHREYFFTASNLINDLNLNENELEM